jgi:tape measure domain-containing protein
VIVRELATLLNFRTDMRGADQYDNRLDTLKRAAAAAAAAIAAAFSVKELVRAGDEYTTSMNRIGAATNGPEQAAAAYEGLYTSARETGVAVVDTTKAFLRFNPAMGKLGYSLEDTISLVDGVQKGLLAAGSSAAETSNIFVQLGQAVNANNFAGDELKAFLENSSPTLVNAMAEAIGTTADKLKEMGSEGKLTNKNVLPALLAAAKAGRDEFGKMRVTVELAMARSKVAFDRFLSSVDQGFAITQKLARGIEVVGRKLDEWRRYIPVVRDAINEFGGLERVLGAVALGVGVLTTGILVLNGALAAMVTRLLIIPGLFITAAAVIGAVLQDFYLWTQGGDTKTVFGEMFGSFQDLVGPLKGAMNDIKTLFIGTPDDVIKAWDRLKGYFRDWAGEAFANFPPAIKRSLGIEGLGERAARQATPPGVEPPSSGEMPRTGSEPSAPSPRRISTDAAPARANPTAIEPENYSTEPLMNRLKGWISDGLGAIGFRRQAQMPDGTMQPIPPGVSMRDVLNAQMLNRMGPTTRNTTVNAPATINNNVTVNATGVSGPEVAAGASRGVEQATSTLTDRFDQLSRQLGMSMPDAEGAGGLAP